VRPPALGDGVASGSPGIGGKLYLGSSAFLAVYLAGAAISVGVQLAMARLLGAESYGNYIYAVAWAPLFLLGCNFGLKPTVVRFVAAYNARDQGGLLRGVVGTATRWTAIASMVVVAIVLGVLWVARGRIDNPVDALALVALAMPFMALCEVWSSIVRGLGAVVRSQIPASLVQQASLGIALVGLVAVYGAHGGAVLASGAFLIASIGAMLAAAWLAGGQLSRRPRDAPPQFERRAWLHVAWGNLLIATFQAARAPLIIVIAGAYVEAQQLAFYGAAQRLANVMSFGLIAISAQAAPRISGYFAVSDVDGLRRLARVASRGALAVALATALLMSVLGPQLLRLFGEGFEIAYVPLLVLLFGEMAAAMAGPVGFFMSMTGLHKTAAWIEGITSAFVLLIAFVIVPRHGVLGAAIAVASGSVLRNAAMAIVVRRRLRLQGTAIKLDDA